MTESLAVWTTDRIPDEQRTRAEAAIDKLTPAEQRRILAEMLASIREHGKDPEMLVWLANSFETTVMLRTRVPGYREMVAESGRRATERLGT